MIIETYNYDKGYIFLPTVIIRIEYHLNYWELLSGFDGSTLGFFMENMEIYIRGRFPWEIPSEQIIRFFPEHEKFGLCPENEKYPLVMSK